MLLILGGRKGNDATAACPLFRLVELHLLVEFAFYNCVACAINFLSLRQEINGTVSKQLVEKLDP